MPSRFASRGGEDDPVTTSLEWRTVRMLACVLPVQSSLAILELATVPTKVYTVCRRSSAILTSIIPLCMVFAATNGKRGAQHLLRLGD